MTSLRAVGKVAGLGIAGGLRFTFPLVALSRSSLSLPAGSAIQPFLTVLRHAPTPTVLPMAAFGEVLGDKLPFVPPRTNAGPLVGRILGTGLVGGTVAMSEGAPFIVGAVVGGLAAGWTSFAATNGRAALVAMGVPDLLVGLVEDGLAGALALAAVSNGGSKVA